MKPWQILFLAFLGVCLAASLILMGWMSPQASLRAGFGFFYFFFLPGLIWSYCFFSEKRLDVWGRIAFALFFSMVTMGLGVHFLHTYFSLPLSSDGVMWVVVISCVIGLLGVLVRTKIIPVFSVRSF